MNKHGPYVQNSTWRDTNSNNYNIVSTSKYAAQVHSSIIMCGKTVDKTILNC